MGVTINAKPLGKRPNTLFTGGWVGPSPDQKRCGRSRLPLELDPQVIQPVAGRYRDALTLGDDFSMVCFVPYINVLIKYC